MTDAFRQPSLFYHLGVRESFSMANNIILYCDLNSDSLHSLQVRKSFVSVSPESRIKLVKFKLKGSFFQHLTFHKLPVWSLETKNIRGQKYCHNIFSHIIQYQNLSLNSFTKNCWYWSKNVHYVDMCSMRKKKIEDELMALVWVGSHYRQTSVCKCWQVQKQTSKKVNK